MRSFPETADAVGFCSGSWTRAAIRNFSANRERRIFCSRIVDLTTDNRQLRTDNRQLRTDNPQLTADN